MNQTGRETGTTGSCGRNYWSWQLRTVSLHPSTALLPGSFWCFIPTGGRGSEEFHSLVPLGGLSPLGGRGSGFYTLVYFGVLSPWVEGGSELLGGGPTISIPGRNVLSLPSLQDLRKVSVESISFLILIRASSTMGPHLQQKSQITDPAEPPDSGFHPCTHSQQHLRGFSSTATNCVSIPGTKQGSLDEQGSPGAAWGSHSLVLITEGSASSNPVTCAVPFPLSGARLRQPCLSL